MQYVAPMTSHGATRGITRQKTKNNKHKNSGEEEEDDKHLVVDSVVATTTTDAALSVFLGLFAFTTTLDTSSILDYTVSFSFTFVDVVFSA